MKLIVGLGNIGKEYENTRHNIGFMVLDNYVGTDNFKLDKKLKSYVAFKTIADQKVIFIKPTTYMNLSGEAVSLVMNYYKINLKDILVIYDDINFELGDFRLRQKGSSGGHNGIKNIISLLKNDNINRLKIGIGKNSNNLKDYVLNKFSNNDMKIIEDLYDISLDIIDGFVIKDMGFLMNEYN